jgi:N-acetylneuraminate synthase
VKITKNKNITNFGKPYIIAELGSNHNGDMKLAKEMVYAASEAGADFAKFQTWSVEKLKKGPWDDDGRLEIYKKAGFKNSNNFKLQTVYKTNKLKNNGLKKQYNISIYEVHY